MRVWTILKREVYSFFTTPMAYVLLTVWLFFSGFVFSILAYWSANQPFGGGPQESPLTAFFGQTMLFYLPILVFVPLITMRLIAEERSRGTLELLMTAPVTAAEVVLGKYLASLVYWLAMWVPTLLYVWLTSRYGDVDMGAVGASYLGIFGIGAYYLAIGVLMSALAKNQIISAILTFLTLAGLFVLGLGQYVMGEEHRELFGYLSVLGHMEAFSRGVVDTRYLTFDISLAALAIALAIAAMRRTEVRLSPREGEDRSVWEKGFYAAASIPLLLGLAFQVNYLSYRHYDRWDWTAHSIYTLSPRTEAELDRLEEDVEIWILLSQAEGGGATELGNLLARYRAYDDRITVHIVDPDRDPGAYREVAQRFSLSIGQMGEVVVSDVAAVVAAGERHWEITRDDLLSAHMDPESDENTIELNVESERAITGALVELRTGEPTRICVTSGHGEFLVSGGGRSLEAFGDEMRRENLEMVAIETRGQEEIGEGCKAIAIIGPEIAFGAEEVEALRAYVRGGGNLMVAMDPVLPRGQSTFLRFGLEDMLRDFGVDVGRSIIIEPSRELLPPNGSPIGPFFVVGWSEHTITQGLRGHGLPLIVTEVRSVTPLDAERASVLLTTSSESYGETDIRGLSQGEFDFGADAADIAGPVPIAVATRAEVLDEADGGEGDGGEGEAEEDESLGGRVVVIGDASMFSSDFLHEPIGVNRLFASAAVGWLTEREALAAIDSRTIRHRPVSLSQDDVNNLFLRVVVLIPLAFIFLGFAVWWNRRS